CLICVVDDRCLTELLKAYEEEGLVAAYWTAKRKAVVVPPGPRTGIVAKIGERIARVECLVQQILVPSSMELVGAPLHRHIEDATADLTILGCKVARLNRDLLDRIHAGLALCRNAWCT